MSSSLTFSALKSWRLALALWYLTNAPGVLMAADWPEYLGGANRACYSPLDQITSGNVARLRVAWEFHSGDPGQMQCNPIVVGGMLFGATATNHVFALDAATGREIWRFEEPGHEFGCNQRGVVYWANGDDRCILFNIDSWLYAVDARTGKSISKFGGDGRVSLKTGLGERAKDKWVVCTSPGTVFDNLIIMPTRVGELGDSALGHVQAFDIRDGKLATQSSSIGMVILRTGNSSMRTAIPRSSRHGARSMRLISIWVNTVGRFHWVKSRNLRPKAFHPPAPKIMVVRS